MKVNYKEGKQFPIELVLNGGSQWLTKKAARELKSKLEEILKEV